MNDGAAWIKLAVQYYLLSGLIVIGLVCGGVYGCYRLTGHGVSVEVK